MVIDKMKTHRIEKDETQSPVSSVGRKSYSPLIQYEFLYVTRRDFLQLVTHLFNRDHFSLLV